MNIENQNVEYKQCLNDKIEHSFLQLRLYYQEHGFDVNGTVNSAINGVQLTERQRYIYNAIAASTSDVSVNGTVNGTVNAPLLSTLLDVPLRTIKRDLYFMRDMGLIHRVGSDKGGHWEIIDNN